MNRKLIPVVLALPLLMGPCMPEKVFDTATPFNRKARADESSLGDRAALFLQNNSKADEDRRWFNTTPDRIHQRQRDGAASEENAADDMLKEWLASRSTTLTDIAKEAERRENDLPKQAGWKEAKLLSMSDRIGLCRWYLLYVQKRWTIPPSIAPYLTEKNYTIFVDGVLPEEKKAEVVSVKVGPDVGEVIKSEEKPDENGGSEK